MWSRRQGSIPRRHFLKGLGSLVGLTLVADLAAACSQAAPPPAPTKAPAPASQPTAAPSQPTAAPTAKPAWKPSRPVQLIVQYAAGGGVDINARIVAQFAEKYLGQSIQAVNKEGGSGVIGMKEWINSKPDGQMLGVMTNAGLTDPLLMKDAPYKTEQIQPIVEIAYEPDVLVVLPGTKVDKPIKELMAYIKSQPPESIKCGVGSLWTGQDFTRASMDFYGGFQMARVSFGGGAPVVTALLGGHIDLSVPYVSEVISHVKSGALKAIAVAGPERSKALPDVPTFIESGWPDISWGVFRMIAVPKGTPGEIVAAYGDVFTKTLKDPDTLSAYQKAGLEVVYRNTADSEKYLQSELQRHKGLIEKLGVKPQ